MGLGLTVAECKDRIDSREFTDWMAFYDVEPWGEQRMDLRFAHVLTMLAAACGVKDASIEDFMLTMPDEERMEIKRRRMRERLKQLAARMDRK